jgi:hypothetical protein
VVVIVVGLLGVSACGGASPGSSTTHTAAANPEQARLLSELRSGLEDPGSPVATVRDLDECIVQEAKNLPLATVRRLVGANPGAAVADPLVARCVAQGKGLSWVRGTIADVVAGKLPPPIPAAFSKCVVAGVGRLTPAQLAASLNGSAGGQSDSRRLGQRIALDASRSRRCSRSGASFGSGTSAVP